MITRPFGACATLLATACLAAGPALAHVTLQTREAPVNSSYKAVLKVPHGCNGSPTTELKVRVPEGLIGAKPQPKAGWTLHVTEGKYAQPHTLYHREVDSGITEIAWTGGNLPDNFYDEFVFVGYLSGDLTPDSTLYVPVVQVCEEGTTRWIDQPSGSEADAHLDTPAPALKLLPAQP